MFSPDYPVKQFSGTKSIVISTVSWIGGKQPFLGWAYIAAAILCVVLAVAGLIRHLVKPRKLGDMTRWCYVGVWKCGLHWLSYSIILEPTHSTGRTMIGRLTRSRRIESAGSVRHPMKGFLLNAEVVGER